MHATLGSSAPTDASYRDGFAYVIAGTGPFRSYIVRELPGRGEDGPAQYIGVAMGEGLRLATVLDLIGEMLPEPNGMGGELWAYEVIYRDRVAATLTQTRRGPKVKLAI